MIECPTCHRHHYVDSSACPFCKKPAIGMGKTLAAALTTFVLAACYGTVDGTKTDGESGDSGPTTPTTTETEN
jgi:hypothetical protein